MIKPLYLFCCCALLASCVLPKTIENAEDERCQLVTREMTLDVIHGYMPYCYGDDCIAEAVFIAGTAVVSGSIMVVNNTVHWLEKQGKCGEPDAANQTVSGSVELEEHADN